MSTAESPREQALPSSTRQTILLVDGWLANAGDAAINLATSLTLRRELPGARVVLAGHHRSLMGASYPELDLAPPLDAVAGVSWPWTTPQDLAEGGIVDRLVEEADLVVAAGGGYMLERYKPEGRIKGYEYLLERGKRLAFYAQSIGRFKDPALRARLGTVLVGADLVLVRDEPSLEVVRELRSPEGVHLTADEAFLLPVNRRIATPRSLLVTASVHPWERDDGTDELRDDSHLEQIAAALTRILSSGLARTVTLASTVQGVGWAGQALEDDDIAASRLQAAVPAQWRNRIRRSSGYLTANRYAELAARHAAVISMRMHGAILAAVAGTPVLLANASDKALSLSRRSEGRISTISSRSDLGRLDELVAPLLEDLKGARLRQNAAVEQMRALARANAQLVSDQLR
ncbi:MAG: polysaccharide pyruvyl transferase family protein [Solirubrobacterales bacterium]